MKVTTTTSAREMLRLALQDRINNDSTRDALAPALQDEVNNGSTREASPTLRRIPNDTINSLNLVEPSPFAN